MEIISDRTTGTRRRRSTDVRPPSIFAIVIPCYNEVSAIGNTVEQILRTVEEEDFELVVVDDGSDDGTAQVLADLEQQHGRLRVLTHDRNRGYGRR